MIILKNIKNDEQILLYLIFFHRNFPDIYGMRFLNSGYELNIEWSLKFIWVN